MRLVSQKTVQFSMVFSVGHVFSGVNFREGVFYSELNFPGDDFQGAIFSVANFQALIFLSERTNFTVLLFLFYKIELNASC